MASNKGVNIKVTSETKEAKKGLDSITKQLNQMSNAIKKSPVTKLADSFNIFTKAASTVTKAVKAAKDAINETIEAYNIQRTAEVQLEAAAKNNPYLNAANIQQLKDYASQLQSISTVGDEQLIPMMAQLAAAGRTQAEIQDIMSAAVNVAASGTMSLESAVKNLNKTYSGLSGELGEANPAIKSLTTEQLKSGEAVKVLASQYAGMAASVANATGGWKQFQNTLGDLKELIGQSFAEKKNAAGQILNSFFTKIQGAIASASKSAEDFKKELGLIAESSTTANSSSKEIQGDIDAIESQLARVTDIKNLAEKSVKDFTSGYEKQLKELRKKEKEETAKLEQELEKIRFKALAQRNQQGRAYQAGDTAEYDRLGQEITDLGKQEDELALKIKNRKENFSLVESDIQQSIRDAEKTINDANMAFITGFNGSMSAVDQQIETLNNRLVQKRSELSAALKKESDEDTRTEEQKALDLYNANRDALEKELAEIKRRYEMNKAEGKQTDDLAKKKEELAAKEKAYWDLITTDRSLITEKSSRAVKAMQELSALYKEIYGEEIKLPELNLDETLPKEEQIKQLEDYKALLVSMQADLDPAGAAFKSFAEAIKKTGEAIDNLSKKQNEWSAKSFTEKAEFIAQQATTLGNSVSSALSTASEAMSNQASADMTNLENAYAKGEVTEEEYYEKKAKLEKKAAQDQYKMQLAEWALNLTMTQSEMALAIAKALSSGTPPLSYITAAVTGAAAAAQLAAQIAAKPVPPAYSAGGVVGGFTGATLGNDNTYIHAKNGEMFLNARQQKTLYDIANGTSSSGAKWDITVNNEAGDVASASASADSSGIQIAVKKIVGDAMAGGEFNDSYQAMQAGIYGRRITD